MSTPVTPPGADEPGTVYVTPGGDIYRLQVYEQTFSDLVDAVDKGMESAEAPWSPVYAVFTRRGGAAFGGIGLPDDAVKVWTP